MVFRCVFKRIDPNQVFLTLDPDHVPDEEEASSYLAYLSLRPPLWSTMKFFQSDLDPDYPTLLPIAAQSLKDPLPPSWVACLSDDEEVYFFNFDTHESRWEHPNEIHHRDAIFKAKAKAIKKREIITILLYGMQHCPFSPFYFLPPELLQNILQFTSLDDFDYIQRPGYERRLKQQRQRTNRMFQKRIDLSNDEERSIRMAIKTLELSVRQSGKCNNSVQKEPESNVSIFQHEKDKPHSRTQFHAVTSQRLVLSDSTTEQIIQTQKNSSLEDSSSTFDSLDAEMHSVQGVERKSNFVSLPQFPALHPSKSKLPFIKRQPRSQTALTASLLSKPRSSVPISFPLYSESSPPITNSFCIHQISSHNAQKDPKDNPLQTDFDKKWSPLGMNPTHRIHTRNAQYKHPPSPIVAQTRQNSKSTYFTYFTQFRSFPAQTPKRVVIHTNGTGLDTALFKK